MTIDEAQQKIITEMSGLKDWLDKYQYLISFGKEHGSLDHELKTEENALPGCQSKVWIHAEVKDNQLIFKADSDSLIIKGILALLLKVLNHHSPKDIVAADLYFISEIGLSTNLSPSRANGVALIVKQLKFYANKVITENK